MSPWARLSGTICTCSACWDTRRPRTLHAGTCFYMQHFKKITVHFVVVRQTEGRRDVLTGKLSPSLTECTDEVWESTEFSDRVLLLMWTSGCCCSCSSSSSSFSSEVKSNPDCCSSSYVPFATMWPWSMHTTRMGLLCTPGSVVPYPCWCINTVSSCKHKV